MIVIVSDGFYRHVIARLEVRGFHFAHRRKIFGVVLNLDEDDAVVARIDHETLIGNFAQAAGESFGRPVDLLLSVALRILAAIIARIPAAHAGQLDSAELRKYRRDG